MFPVSYSTLKPSMCPPPNLYHFNEISENEVLKIIKNFPIKSSFRSSAYFLCTLCGRYSTRYNRPDKRLLVSQFYPSVHKKRHFGHSFASDALAVWNNLPDEVHSVPNEVPHSLGK